MALRFLTFCMTLLALFLILWSIEVTCFTSQTRAEPVFKCQPTPEDEMGPLYKPKTPIRNSVGQGYLLFGEVKSAADCNKVENAKIEVWLSGPEGLYGEDWRATLFSTNNGKYYFSSHTPPDYGTGRAHIHLKVTADGFKELVTQHYPVKGSGEGLFDLVLVPVD